MGDKKVLPGIGTFPTTRVGISVADPELTNNYLD
jgi:hypothetical protein